MKRVMDFFARNLVKLKTQTEMPDNIFDRNSSVYIDESLILFV